MLDIVPMHGARAGSWRPAPWGGQRVQCSLAHACTHACNACTMHGATRDRPHPAAATSGSAAKTAPPDTPAASSAAARTVQGTCGTVKRTLEAALQTALWWCCNPSSLCSAVGTKQLRCAPLTVTGRDAWRERTAASAFCLQAWVGLCGTGPACPKARCCA